MEQERWLKEIFIGRVVNPVTLHGQVIGSTVQRPGENQQQEEPESAAHRPQIAALLFVETGVF